VSDELLKEICRDGVDITTACELVEYAEESNEKVFDESAGIYHAHKRIGNITLWVSYVKTDAKIEIKEVYTHRMDIKEGKEMKKVLSKLLSLLLALVLVFQIIPQQVYAEAGLCVGGEGSALGDEYTVSPALVDGEIETLRSESGKHFRLTDGTFLSVEYYQPVHFEDEQGIWQDIDNTLFFDEETQSLRTVKNGGSSFSFSKDLFEGNLLSASWGEYEVSVGLIGDELNKDSNAEIIETKDEEKEKTEEGWTASDLMPLKLTSKLLYKEVFEGTDFEYTIHGYDLKECIRVNEMAEEYSFSFLLRLKGLSATLNENKSISLLNDIGEEIYLLPAPFMQDAKGAFSFDAEYILSETEEGTVITVSADPSWINEDERAFPVVIDPSFRASAANNTYTSSSNIYTTYTLSYYPYQGIAQWGMPQHLFIGYDPSSGATRGYVHFHNLPSIPSGCEIIGAEYAMYLFSPYWDGYNGYYGYNLGQIPLVIKEVTSAKPSYYGDYYSWFTYLNWNDQWSMSYGPALDYALAGWGDAGSYIDWDITGLAKKWYSEGTENRTV
ncbi:MAG: hypothetical protein IJJ48_07635, partial [Firmicutes bacterium]|nr:hypothetical protein [Bacillota bacterium]